MILRGTARAAIVCVFGIWFLQMTGCASPQEIAQTSLVDLKKSGISTDPVVPGERDDYEVFAKDIGFDSLGDMSEAQLGTPLHLYTVPLVQLKTFQPKDDPSKLLQDTSRIIFPLTVKGQLKSSLIVEESSLSYMMNNWKMSKSWKGARVTGTGLPKLMQKIEHLKPSNSSFLVLIAPLRIVLLGDRKAGRFVLTPLENNPNFKLIAGNERDAAELLGNIVPSAKLVYERDQQIRGKSPERGIPERPNTERAPYAR